MSRYSAEFKELPWPRLREIMIDTLKHGASKKNAHIQTEADITVLSERMKRFMEETRKPFSLTSYILYCYARALNEFKFMQACGMNNKKLTVFDDVDVCSLYDKTKPDGLRIPVAYVFREANRKSLAQLMAENKRALHDNLMQDKNVKKRAQMVKLPTFIRNILWQKINSNALLNKEAKGTVVLTSVGYAYGSRRGFGFMISPQPCSLAVCSTFSRVCLENSKVYSKLLLGLVITYNNSYIETGYAADFVDYLVKLIERGEGLTANFYEEYKNLLETGNGRR